MTLPCCFGCKDTLFILSKQINYPKTTKSKEIIYQIKIKSKEITILHLFQMLNIITFGERYNLKTASSVQTAVKGLVEKGILSDNHGIRRPTDLLFMLWLKDF